MFKCLEQLSLKVAAIDLARFVLRSNGLAPVLRKFFLVRSESTFQQAYLICCPPMVILIPFGT